MFYGAGIVEKEVERLDQMVEDGLVDHTYMAYFRVFLVKISKLVHGDISVVEINRSLGVECFQALARIVKYFDLDCETCNWRELGVRITQKKVAYGIK